MDELKVNFSRKQWIFIGIAMAIIAVAVFLFVIGKIQLVQATGNHTTSQIPKVYICHCNEAQCNTLHLPLTQALGHVHHESDYQGVCRDVEVTVTPSPEITETPEATPTATITPTEEPKKGGDSPQPNNPNDGRSDGGRSSDFAAKEHPQVTLEPCRPGVCGYK